MDIGWFTIEDAGLWIAVAFAALCAAGVLLGPYLYVCQGQGYRAKAFLGGLQNRAAAWDTAVQLAVVLGAMLGWWLGPVLFSSFAGLAAAPLGMCCLLLAGAFAAALLRGRRAHKKPFVLTARVCRLIALSQLPPLAVMAAFALAGKPDIAIASVLFFIIWAPFWVILSGAIAAPLEKALQSGYIRKAKRKLAAMSDLTVIGITGSYGKTSAKFILQSILSQEFTTVSTPHSYTTPMGVCRAIAENLDENHRVFICEMGARHKGDIASLCRLVQSRLALVTAVGPQHLETFGSVETIADTKFELIDSLPEGGCAALPADGAWGDALYKKTRCNKLRYGLEGEGLDVTARNVQTGAWGSRFELVIGDESAQAATCLLGAHNIHNILGAAAIAHHMGVGMDKIIAGIEAVAPIPHRLELVRRDGDIIVIDDAYNASPAGTRAALAVLACFPGRRIMVTPGLIELGQWERDENVAFGRALADVCQKALFVGQPARTQALADGWREGGGAIEDMFIFPSLRSARAHLEGMLAPGDVVLFENDLPDHLEG